MPDGRLLYRRPVYDPNFNASDIYCRAPDGGGEWTTRVMGYVRSSLITTDGLIYFAAVSNHTTPFVIALRQSDGTVAWTYNYSPGGGSLYEMRIVGNNLLVGGSTYNSKAELISLNRLTGTLNFKKTYTNREKALRLRANTTSLFLGLDGSVNRINSANGDILATSNGGEFQVDSANNVYVASIDHLTRFNFNANGLITSPVYSVPTIGEDEILIAGGAVYGSIENNLVKYKPSDGSVQWARTLPNETRDTFPVMKVDPVGRLYVITQNFYSAQISSGIDEYTGNWAFRVLDTATGNDVTSLQVALSNQSRGASMGNGLAVNSFGEVLLTGSRPVPTGQYDTTRGYAVLLYQKPEPMPDSYSCVENEHFATSGNGVLKNDRYVNPSKTTAILISPPAQGTVVMGANGEFTYNAAGVAPGDYTFTYEASRGSLSGTAVVTMRVTRGLLDLTLTRSSLAGQNATLGTVTMSSAGAATMVAIYDDSSLVTTPSSVSVATGQVSAGFAIHVLPVTSPIVTHISATQGGFTRKAILNLVPLVPTALAFTPSSTVVGGNPVTCRVVLNGVAGANGRIVSIYDNNAYSTVPSQILIPAGATQGTFTIQTIRPNILQNSKITAAVTAGQASANLRITP